MNIESKQPFYIVSVMRSALTPEANIDRHEETKVWLSSLNIPYKVVKGVYKGQSELSFLIPANERAFRVASALAKDYEQDCFLYSDENRNTSLVYSNDNKTESIGVFTRIMLTDNLDSYTVDLETGQAWTTL